MPDYAYLAWGRSSRLYINQTIEVRFTAADDTAALHHAASDVVRAIENQLESADGLELYRTADETMVGAFDVKTGSWTLGQIALADRPALNPNEVPVHDRYNRRQLDAAFALIRNKEGWKMPFDALVPADAELGIVPGNIGGEAILDVLQSAAIFFAGSPLEIVKTESGWHVEGPGYYVCIGA